MNSVIDVFEAFLSLSMEQVLALIALGVLGLAAFAIFVVYAVVREQTKK